MAQTIEDLLSLSRLQQGRIITSLGPMDLNEMIGHYVTDRTLVFDAKGLTLDFYKDSTLPMIQADKGLIGQVLSILLTNACHYTPTDGRVVVRTFTRRADVHFWAGFSVSDTGPGISPDDQLQLFTRFFRGRVGQQSKVPGTGLGLAIVKHIMEAHGGRASCASTVGQGSRFSVFFPA